VRPCQDVIAMQEESPPPRRPRPRYLRADTSTAHVNSLVTARRLVPPNQRNNGCEPARHHSFPVRAGYRLRRHVFEYAHEWCSNPPCALSRVQPRQTQSSLARRTAWYSLLRTKSRNHQFSPTAQPDGQSPARQDATRPRLPVLSTLLCLHLAITVHHTSARTLFVFASPDCVHHPDPASELWSTVISTPSRAIHLRRR